MTAPPVDLAEFRLLRALRAGASEAPFTQLWNAQAGAVWSVLRAMVDRDAEALGWMASFRVDLQQRCVDLRADEGVAPQMGRALYAHAAPGFLETGPLPPHPLPPDELGVRALPPATRLAYLVDLFFDWAPPDPNVRAAHRLLEPDDDTDSRLLVYTALLRNPPGDAKILPPGALPDDARPRRTPAGAFVLGLLAALVFGAWGLAQLPVSHHAAPEAQLPAGLELEDGDPARLSRRLEIAGVPSGLAWCVDLSAAGLTLRSAQVDAEGVELQYAGRGAEWTLRHEAPGHAAPANDAPDGGALATALNLDTEGGLTRASWRDTSGRWALAANAAPEEVLAVAQRALGTTAPNGVPSPAP